MKPCIVLIHGWAMPSNIFDSLTKRLSHQFDFIVPKLPGDIGCAYQGEASLEDFANRVLAQVDTQAIWLGWSLGGLLAMQIALSRPKLVESIIMVTSNLKYVADKSWSHGIQSSVLSSFAHALQKDYDKTLSQFLSLQTMYTSNQRDLIKNLRLMNLQTPDLDSLQAQLTLLQTVDLRQRAQKLSHHTLWIMGDKDRLVPPESALATSKIMPHSQVKIIKNAGHLPFWTHPQQFDQEILNWVMSA